MITIFVLARVRIYREGLVQSLAGRPAVAVAGSATTPVEAWAGLHHHRPDVLLLDLGADRSLSFAREVRSAMPGVRIIGLAVSGDAADVVACAESGMSGYLTADATLTELVDAIGAVVRGETACPPHVTAVLFERLAARAVGHRPDLSRPDLPRLTGRELEIVDLIQRRLSNKEIAPRAVHLGVDGEEPRPQRAAQAPGRTPRRRDPAPYAPLSLHNAYSPALVVNSTPR